MILQISAFRHGLPALTSSLDSENYPDSDDDAQNRSETLSNE
jgi:hypothetical protein